jgi:hypothetical protein
MDGALAFDLHQLGWFSFEQLCRTISREIWRQPIEVYSRGPDGGRDGFLYGPWREDAAEFPGILQCKHTAVASAHLAPSDMKTELKKVKRHVAAGRCDVYVVMTNARVTGDSAATIAEAFRGVGVWKVLILGYESLCELLTEQKSLRALVPRLYGLGDLTEILDERHYVQAEAILAMMHDHLARLVPVEAHRAAHRALRTQRFALLIGRPGSGKSSIAASLAIGAMDLYDARPVKLSRIDELHDRWNPREPNQFFWLDDGFGPTQYEYTAADSWNRATPAIAAALRGGARLVVTSRDYVYAAARKDLKISAFPLLEEAQVVIEVESFGREEREQILYNHLKLGAHDSEVLESMRPEDLEAVAADASFLPELARRLGDPLFTQSLYVRSRESLLDFFRRPTPFLLELLLNLDRASRAALGLVHLHSNHLASPYVEEPGDGEFLRRLGVDVGDALQALAPLDGSLLRLVSVAGDRWWQFQHPTFADAYQLWLAGQPELLAEYITSARLEDLARTITCGDIGLQGAIVAPRRLYDAVATRFIEARSAVRWGNRSIWRRTVFSFLRHRCDDEFLRLLIGRDRGIVDEVFNIGLYLSAHTVERDLARRLLDVGLATELHRNELVETLTDYAVEGYDGSFLSDEKWLWFFTKEELEELDRRVLEELELLEDRVADGLSDPEGDVSSADESVAGYEARYPGHPHVVAARQRVENFSTYEPDPDSDAWKQDESEESPPGEPANPRRSIFEDLVAGTR